MKQQHLHLKRGEQAYKFLIRRPPTGGALDDLAQNALAKLHAYVIADNPTSDDYIFIVATTDQSITAHQILQVLNEHLGVDAEFIETV